MNSRAWRACGVPGAELGHGHDDRAPREERAAGPPLRDDRDRVLVAGRAQRLDGARADHVLERRPAPQRRQRGQRARRARSPRPAPPRPRRSSCGRPAAAAPPAPRPRARRRGIRRARPPPRAARAGARRRGRQQSSSASSRRVCPSARAAAARTAQKRSPRSASPSARTEAGSTLRRRRRPRSRGRCPGAPPPAGGATAGAASPSSATSAPRRRDRRSPASGAAGRWNSNAWVAASTLTVSSRSWPSTSKRTRVEKRNSGASALMVCFWSRRSVPTRRSASHSQLASSSGWPARAIQRSKNSSTLRPETSSIARARSRVSTEPRACCGVELERAPEQVVAQLVAQHVQDAAALFVEVAVEDVDRLLVLPADHRPLVAARFVQVTLGVGEQLDVGLVAPLVRARARRTRSRSRTLR